MSATLDLAGVTTGVVTAFRPDGSIDWHSMERHIDFLKGKGLKGLLANAMMAEGLHLTRAERDSSLKFILERTGGELPVIATIFGANTNEAADEAYIAAHSGARALLVFPHPAFGGQPLDPAIPVGYFRAIHQRSGLPVIVFRLPAATAPSLDMDVIERLADEKGVLGIKDSVADMSFYEARGAALLSTGHPLKVFIDRDPVLPDYAARGVYGAMSIAAAAFPQPYVNLFHASSERNGDKLADRLSGFSELIFRAPKRDFRARLKEALRAQGIVQSSRVRPPLPPLTQRELDEVVAVTASTHSSLLGITN
ncbi:dihydrodipicolinate synthase family protein [Burkholderia cenocepacia]|nr:dihydrodipicolinate synthase family protein [Burkholderia cenocepacia]